MAIIPPPFVSEPQKSQGITSPCYTEGGGLRKLRAGHRLHVLAGGGEVSEGRVGWGSIAVGILEGFWKGSLRPTASEGKWVPRPWTHVAKGQRRL